MKRLFQVVDRTTGKPLFKGFFDNKMKAKAYRDTLPNAKIALGPDHRRYVS